MHCAQIRSCGGYKHYKPIGSAGPAKNTFSIREINIVHIIIVVMFGGAQPNRNAVITARDTIIIVNNNKNISTKTKHYVRLSFGVGTYRE